MNAYELLKLFCAEKQAEIHKHCDITKPVILDEYTVATDVFSMAWIHEHLTEASAPEKMFPKTALEMIREFDALPDNQFMPVNFTPKECKHSACDTCNGKRRDFLVRCSCGGYEKYCDECHGEGVWFYEGECCDCDGTGLSDLSYERQAICDIEFNPRFLERLFAFTDCKYFVRVGNFEEMHFRAGTIHGVIKGFRKDKQWKPFVEKL